MQEKPYPFVQIRSEIRYEFSIPEPFVRNKNYEFFIISKLKIT